MLAGPSCRRVIETKSGQNRMFDPGGSEGRLRACSFSGTRRALLYEEVLFLERLFAICNVFWRIDNSGFKFLQELYRQIIYAARITLNRWFFAARLALNMPCQAMEAGRVNRCQGASWNGELDGKELRGALGDEHELEPRGCRVFWASSTHPSSPTTVGYAGFKV